MALQQSSIGYVRNTTAVDSIYLDTKAPTGWVDPTAITVSYNKTTRIVTLTGTLSYYWRGVKTTLTSFVSTAHSATLGSYFLWSTDGVTFTWTTTPWTFDGLMVAYVYTDASNKFALREVHSTLQWPAHEEFHRTIGTYKESGGVLGSYVLASTIVANRRPTATACVVHDQDILTTITSLSAGSYTQQYLTSTGINTFTLAAAEIVPVLASNPYYNKFSTPNWVQTLMANNSYMSIWLVASPTGADADSQNYRFFWVQGQTNGSLASEQSLTPAALNLGTLTSVFTEFVFIARVIIRYQGGDWDFTQVDVLTTTRQSAATTLSGAFEPVLTTATSDPTPVNTDEVISIRAVTGTLRTTYTNVKAFFKTYFDTIYAQIAGSASQAFSTAALTVSGAVSATGEVTSSGARIGYSTGAGGAVTQTTSKANIVTLNKPTGQITTFNDALGAGSIVTIPILNSFVVSTDSIIVTQSFNSVSYNTWVYLVQTGVFYVAIKNISGGSLSDSFVFNFSVVKSVTA